MGAAHRSEHRRTQAIKDRFETLRTRRLALSAETVGPRNLPRSLARFDPHAYSTSAVTLLGAHCATARERAGMWLMLQLGKDERVVDARSEMMTTLIAQIIRFAAPISKSTTRTQSTYTNGSLRGTLDRNSG